MVSKEDQIRAEIKLLELNPFFGTMTNGTVVKSPCSERINTLKGELKGRYEKERDMLEEEICFLEEEVLPKLKVKKSVIDRISNLKAKLNYIKDVLK